MNKIFNIDNIKITISDEIYQLAVKKELISLDNDIYNNAYLKNCIRSGICRTLDDLGNFDFNKIFNEYSESELSSIVEKSIIRDTNELI